MILKAVRTDYAKTKTDFFVKAPVPDILLWYLRTPIAGGCVFYQQQALLARQIEIQQYTQVLIVGLRNSLDNSNIYVFFYNGFYTEKNEEIIPDAKAVTMAMMVYSEIQVFDKVQTW